jgi:hypothetical protein
MQARLPAGDDHSRQAGLASTATLGPPPGDVAEWLRSGLQSRLHRFDSGRRLSMHEAFLRELYDTFNRPAASCWPTAW